MLLVSGLGATLLLFWLVACILFLLAVMRASVGIAFLLLMLSSIVFALIFVLLLLLLSWGSSFILGGMILCSGWNVGV